MKTPVKPESFGRRVPSARVAEDKPESREARAVACHVLRRGASELAADGSFDSFRD